MIHAGYEYDEGQAECSRQEELVRTALVQMFVGRLLQRSRTCFATVEQRE
ncbi:hypothetical protein [Paenibacillus sinopodophylli]|nr:hypothetical protein [Paenibacillus sinopodophylli]